MSDSDQQLIPPPTVTNPAAFPAYKAQVIAAPALSGFSLRLFAGALNGIFGGSIIGKLMHDNGYDRVRPFAARVPHPNPMFVPHLPPTPRELTFASAASAEPGWCPLQMDMTDEQARASGSVILTDYFLPFRTGTLSPVTVVENTLAAIASSNASKRPLRAFIHVASEEAKEAARASLERYRQGRPLSVIDGLPVAVKCEMAVRGQPHSLGTTFLRNRIASEDSIPAAKLRAAGAVLIGMTNMHEIGLGTTGFNAAYGTALNPYSAFHYPGGSSSGSASAVAAGLVPMAVSADGGGSIRIPAALCGVFGLKATFGRVPCEEDIAFTVGHCGPIAATVADCALAYLILSADGTEGPGFYYPQPVPHVKDAFPATMRMPPAPMSAPDHSAAPPAASNEPVVGAAPPVHGGGALAGIRIGVFDAWNKDSSDAFHQGMEAAIERAKAYGATIVPIVIPFLDVAFCAHTVSILSEMVVSCCDRYGDAATFSPPTSASLSLAKALTNSDYIAAQIIRRWMYDYMRNLFATQCDAILTPATAMIAPEMPEGIELPDSSGESNLKVTADIMRFMWLANLTGIPGMTFPVAMESADNSTSVARSDCLPPKLPVALQVMTDCWNEALALKLSALLTRDVPRPKAHYYRDVILGRTTGEPVTTTLPAPSSS